MSSIRIILFLSWSTFALSAQSDHASTLFKTLKAQDSLLFDVGFNTCDISQFEKLVSEDFEFYHDKSGITTSRKDFIANTRDGLCKMSYKAKRVLDPGSLEVYPMENNGILYGALQSGTHRFYAIEGDKPEYLTSTARFMHIWLLEDGQWKLTRVISFDHQQPK